MNDPAMTFDEIGERLGIPGETARYAYNQAILKMKVHMRTREDWTELLEAGLDTDRCVEFLQASLVYGAMTDRGQEPVRRDQTRARSAFKMAYRAFIKGEK